MANILQDIAYGFRMLIKNPAVTAIAAMSLALGIAANTTIFSLINATLLGSLAFSEPERIVTLWSVPLSRPQARGSVGGQQYLTWKERSQSFEMVGAMFGAARNIGGEKGGAPAERVNGTLLSPGMFKVLGVQPLIGRTYSEAEDQINAPAPVMILSHRFWQTKFGGAPDVLGKTLNVDSVETTIIGVMPENFTFLGGNDIDFYAPIGLTSTQIQSTAAFILVFGRLKPGVSIQQAQTEMDGIAGQLRTSDPDRNKDRGIRVEALHETYFGNLRQPLLVLQGAVAFVLLIACANVGGLLLARASARRAEVAVRSALGAGRWRIARQLLTESVILAVVGGAFGVLLAWWGIRLLVAGLPPGALPAQEISLNLGVLGFTAVVSVLAGLFFGVVPAIQTSRVDLAGSLKESGRSAMAGTFRQRLRQIMVTSQIALALMLLIGAGLMINSFLRLQRNELGLDPANVLTFELRFPQAEMMKQIGRHRGVGLWEIFPQTTQTFDRVYERLQNVPGVVSAAAVSIPPLNGGMGMSFTIEGRPAPQPGDNAQGNAMNASYLAISPKYFATMKVPILRGRDFDLRDTGAGTPVVIINQTMAKRFWPDEDPMGKRIKFDWVPEDQPREIVGVVGDTRQSQFQEDTRPTVYVPHTQQTKTWRGPAWNLRAAMYYVVRTPNDPMSILPVLRREISEIDPSKPLAEIRTVEQSIDQQTQGIRLYTVLMSIFGAAAAILASVGIYGVMAYSVAQRTHEIGIRVALGASSGNVLGLVLRQAVLMISIGLVIGVAGAFGLTRFMARELWGVTPTDPPTFVAVSLLIIVVAVLASVIPTRRAVRVDPTVALRYE